MTPERFKALRWSYDPKHGRVYESTLSDMNETLDALAAATADLAQARDERSISHWECANCGREWDHDPEPVETLFCRSGGGSACAEYAVSWKSRSDLAEARLVSAHDVEQAIHEHLKTARVERDQARGERDASAEREVVADDQWYTWQMRAERAEAVALDYARALRTVLDMADKRAHRRIENYVRDVLGNGSEKARTSEHLTKWERETPLAPAAAVAEGKASE